MMEQHAFPVIDLRATGANILRLRKERGLTVRDLQAYFGFEAPQAIYRWQSGVSLPTVDNLYALSILLNVTMEDILEERLGEIWDKNDEVIEDFSPQPDGTVKVLGGAQLDKMFEYFDMDEDEESESVSVGGWVLEQLGKMAEVGDTFEYKNLSVTVTDVEQRRVIEISVKVEEPKEENEEDKED